MGPTQLSASIADMRVRETAASAAKAASRAEDDAEKEQRRKDKFVQKVEEVAKHMANVYAKLGVLNTDAITSVEQVSKLTGKELEAIYFFIMNKSARGNVAAKRAAVTELLAVQSAEVE